MLKSLLRPRWKGHFENLIKVDSLDDFGYMLVFLCAISRFSYFHVFSIYSPDRPLWPNYIRVKIALCQALSLKAIWASKGFLWINHSHFFPPASDNACCLNKQRETDIS